MIVSSGSFHRSVPLALCYHLVVLSGLAFRISYFRLWWPFYRTSRYMSMHGIYDSN